MTTSVTEVLAQSTASGDSVLARRKHTLSSSKTERRSNARKTAFGALSDSIKQTRQPVENIQHQLFIIRALVAHSCRCRYRGRTSPNHLCGYSVGVR